MRRLVLQSLLVLMKSQPRMAAGVPLHQSRWLWGAPSLLPQLLVGVFAYRTEETHLKHLQMQSMLNKLSTGPVDMMHKWWLRV
mmetsp:Transcript_141621/g.353114  ORF Transcript_141621/g.353114 Transcript_141621/m.353114 type:complete len:83 (+) Transcript_141621:548-796(+)